MMKYVTTGLKATALALPLSLGAAAAQAAGVVATIEADDRLETFASALEQAGLADALRTGGPYTVFAPSDAAFEALPATTSATLFAPENRDALRALLGYHVVPGVVLTAAELPAEIETESGTLYITMTDTGPVIARTPEEAFGLVQDLQTTSPAELQDEAPLAQQRAAEVVTATGTVGQDAAAGLLDAVTDLFGAGPEKGGVPISEADIEADNGVVHVIDYILVPATVVEAMPR